MMSATTIGYTGGAVLLWFAGLIGTVSVFAPDPDATVLGIDAVSLIVAVQLLWTVAIAGHLVYSFLSRRDERKLIAELDRSYGAAAVTLRRLIPQTTQRPTCPPSPRPATSPSAPCAPRS